MNQIQNQRNADNQRVSQRTFGNQTRNATQARLRLRTREGSIQDTLSFALEAANPGFKLQFTYENSEGEAKVSVGFQCDEVVEFTNTDGLAYGAGSTLVKATALSSWSDLREIPTGNDFAKMYELATTDGRFRVRTKISNQAGFFNGTDLSPNGAKTDIVLEDWRYNRTDSRLALRCHARTRSQLRLQTRLASSRGQLDVDKPEIAFDQATAGTPSGFLAWNDTAVSSRQSGLVICSNYTAGPDGASMFFTFNGTESGASRIVWDPTVGVTYDLVSSPAPRAVAGTLVAGLLAASLLTVALF